MAEAVAAVGLAASIVQIISTGIQASVYLYNFAETVSSAGKALREIADDISFTTSVLEQLRAILESERHYGTATKEALTTADHLVRECSAVFETIMTLLKKHFPAPEPGRTKRAKLNTLKWPFLQPKIEVMRSNLEKHKTKLIWMTQVLTYAKMAASEQRNLEDEMERERQKLEALVIVSHRVKARSKCKVNPIGLTEVFNPSAPASVDVVFVHGIFGHPKDTWTCAEEDVFWPAELLPPILEDEGTRVLTYGYEAGADAFADGGSRHKIHEVIAKLGIDLASNRQVRKASTRPFVWVAHSLGGLIVKGVLSDSSRSSEQAFPNLRPISVSTYGVIFLSTPHTILPSHIDLLCEAAIHKGVFQIAQNIERLRAKHTALTALNREFLDLAHQYQLHCFREILEPVILDDIAARLSELHAEATCIHSDHYSITKFSSDNSPGFDLQAPQQMRQHTQRMQRPVYQQYQAPLVQQQQQLALAHQMAMQQAVSQTQGQHVSQPPPPASQKQGVLVQQHMAMQGAQVAQAQAHAQAQAQAQAQIQAQAQVQAGQGQAQNQAHQAVPDYNNMKSHGTESSKHKFFKSNRSQALLPGIQERRGSYQPFPTNSLQWPTHPPLSAYYRPSSTDFPLQSPAFLPSSAASYPSPYDAPLQFPAFSTPSAASCPLSPDDKDKNDSLARKYEPESPMACNYWELDATKLYQSNHHGRNVSRGSQSHRMSPSPRSSLGPTINLPNPTHNAAGSPRVDEDLNKLNPNVQEAPAKSERKKKRRFLGFGESSNKEATVTAAAHNQALNQANQQAQDQALAQGYVQNPMPMISVSAREVYNTPTAGKSFSPPIPLRFSSSFSGGQQQQRSSSTGSDLRPQGVTDEYPDPVTGAPVPPASPPPSGYEPFRPWASFGQQIAPIPIIDHSHKPSLKWMRGEERTSNFRQRKKDQSMVQMSVEVGSAEYPSTSTGYFSRETISELSPLRDETGTPMNLKPMEEEDIVAPRQGRRTQSTSHSDSTKPFLAYPARNFKSKDETSPPSEGKMEPIKLKDAVGREFSFPFGLCSTWLGMKDLVNELFSDVPFIGPRVAEGRYDLLGPNNEIVLPAVWETTIESGWTLTMHMWPLPQPKSEELATENMKCPRRKVNSVMRGRPPPPLPAIPLHSNLNMTFGPMDTGALLHESDFDSLLQHNNRHVDFVPSSTNFAEPLRMQRPGRAGIQADSSAESLQRPEKGPLVVPEQELGDEGPRNPLSPDLQNLDATEEERAKAKEEVMKLLRQWTTFDASRLENIGRNGGLAVAMEIDSVG